MVYQLAGAPGTTLALHCPYPALCACPPLDYAWLCDGPALPATAAPTIKLLLTFSSGVAGASRQALELGSTVTGGNFNTVSDWKRLGLIVGVLGLAAFAYRSYNSVSGEQGSSHRVPEAGSRNFQGISVYWFCPRP